tara:strand:+ start:62 stop:940 length:879 start_codon:yes stop_codon:yes gene_type:complete
MDALKLLETLENNSVDLVLTDPPYYKKLDVAWDNQWKTIDNYLIFIDQIVRECERVMKMNGTLYIFASPDMSWHVEGVVRKYFNVINHIRWANKNSASLRCCKENLRKYINNSEEIIVAEKFTYFLYKPIQIYLLNSIKGVNITKSEANKLCGVNGTCGNYFLEYRWSMPPKIYYNRLKKIIDLQIYPDIMEEYDDLYQEYEILKKTKRIFKLSNKVQYNNTWMFKEAGKKKNRHLCQKPDDLIEHIINVSSNENDLIIDMFSGSCVVSKMCEKMNRKFIGCDIDDSFFNSL